MLDDAGAGGSRSPGRRGSGGTRGRRAGQQPLATGRADDRTLPVRARRGAGRNRGARDRRLARLLVDLARRGRPRSRRPCRLPRARPREVRRVAGERRRGRARGVGRARRRRRVCDLASTSRTSSTSCSWTRRRRTTKRSSGWLDRSWSQAGSWLRTTSSRMPTPLAAYSAARQADPSLSSVTVPLDRGLELTTCSLTSLIRPCTFRSGIAEERHPQLVVGHLRDQVRLVVERHPSAGRAPPARAWMSSTRK